MSNNLSIICVNVGNKYSHIYTEKLYQMVERNLNYKYKFYSITDKKHNNKNIIPIKPDNHLQGWWTKLMLFKPNIVDSDYILYFDLDTIIIKPIDKVLSMMGSNLTIVRDTWVKNSFNSSIMLIKTNSLPYIYNSYNEKELDNLKFQKNIKVRGDQCWITYKYPEANIFPEDWFISYKDIYVRKKPVWTNNTMAIRFHGKPNPEDVVNQHEWAKKCWG